MTDRVLADLDQDRLTGLQDGANTVRAILYSGTDQFGEGDTQAVTINNSDPGVFTANASVAITVGGASGSTTLRNTFSSPAPSTRAACSRNHEANDPSFAEYSNSKEPGGSSMSSG